MNIWRSIYCKKHKLLRLRCIFRIFHEDLLADVPRISDQDILARYKYILTHVHLQYMTNSCVLQAIYYIVFLGWCFVPVYMASGVYTMPEYLRYKSF